MKHLLVKLMAVFAITLLLVCCKKEPTQQNVDFEIKQTNLNFRSYGGLKIVDIVSASNWTFNTSSEWIICNKNGNSLNVKLKANEEFIKREGTIIINSANKKSEIHITQDGLSLEFSIDPTYIPFTINGGEAQFKVNTNAPLSEIKIEKTANWFNIVNENNNVTINTEPNNDILERVDTIKVTILKKTINVIVSQEGVELPDILMPLDVFGVTMQALKSMEAALNRPVTLKRENNYGLGGSLIYSYNNAKNKTIFESYTYMILRDKYTQCNLNPLSERLDIKTRTLRFSIEDKQKFAAYLLNNDYIVKEENLKKGSDSQEIVLKHVFYNAENGVRIELMEESKTDYYKMSPYNVQKRPQPTFSKLFSFNKENTLAQIQEEAKNAGNTEISSLKDTTINDVIYGHISFKIKQPNEDSEILREYILTKNGADITGIHSVTCYYDDIYKVFFVGKDNSLSVTKEFNDLLVANKYDKRVIRSGVMYITSSTISQTMALKILHIDGSDIIQITYQ